MLQTLGAWFTPLDCVVKCGNKKVSLICWKKVLASKKNGGLGVSSFFALNRALLFKWIWRFISDGPSLWSRFIIAIHGVRGALDNPLTFSRRSPWLDIVHEFRCLSNNVYPRLYLLEADKHSSVAAKLSDPMLFASFRRPPRGGIKEEQLQLLVASTSSIILPNISDRWIWKLDSSGAYSMKSARNFIDDSFLPKMDLPTRLNLSLRGLDIPSIICPLCSITVESTSHLFFSCHLARQLMLKVARWWEFEIHDFIFYDDWLLSLNNIQVSKRFKDVFEGVCYTTWWAIWKFRNQVLFGSNHPHLDLLFDEIVCISFTWCSSRCNSSFDWVSWMKNPSSINL
ncbi:RNA-directed DNA polymerase, eukaryota, reverse transcriptase zinc-binding domain protein [Tanacetum coccineum]